MFVCLYLWLNISVHLTVARRPTLWLFKHSRVSCFDQFMDICAKPQWSLRSKQINNRRELAWNYWQIDLTVQYKYSIWFSAISSVHFIALLLIALRQHLTVKMRWKPSVIKTPIRLVLVTCISCRLISVQKSPTPITINISLTQWVLMLRLTYGTKIQSRSVNKNNKKNCGTRLEACKHRKCLSYV